MKLGASQNVLQLHNGPLSVGGFRGMNVGSQMGHAGVFWSTWVFRVSYHHFLFPCPLQCAPKSRVNGEKITSLPPTPHPGYSEKWGLRTNGGSSVV